jgi:GTP pyrophosphokinase
MPELASVLAVEGLARVEDAYRAVGFGRIPARQILAPLFPGMAPGHEAEPKPSAIGTVVRKVLGRGESAITVKGQDGLLVYRAKCCNPIRGDDIVGYITRGKGVSVHGTQCPNLVNLLGSDRVTEVEWVQVPQDEVFTVRLAISAEDRQGMLADITSAISNLKTNIRESRARTDDDGKGTIDLTVDINDTRHLRKVIQVLKGIRGIHDVERENRVP